VVLPPARGDVALDVAGEHVERRVAALDDRVVELPQIVSRTERLLCAAALAHHLAVPDLVPAGLAGPRAVAIDLALDLFALVPVALHEEDDALFAAPALVVQACVDHQPASAERLVLQVTEPPGRVLVVGADRKRV